MVSQLTLAPPIVGGSVVSTGIIVVPCGQWRRCRRRCGRREVGGADQEAVSNLPSGGSVLLTEEAHIDGVASGDMRQAEVVDASAQRQLLAGWRLHDAGSVGRGSLSYGKAPHLIKRIILRHEGTAGPPARIEHDRVVLRAPAVGMVKTDVGFVVNAIPPADVRGIRGEGNEHRALLAEIDRLGEALEGLR